MYLISRYFDVFEVTTLTLLLVLSSAAWADDSFQFTQGPAIGFVRPTPGAFTAFETLGSARLTIQRTGPPSSAAVLSYTMQDGTAEAGTDYNATPGTVVFAVGETTRDILIPLVLHPGASLAVNARTFSVTLAPNAATPSVTIGPVAVATVTIVNNDQRANAYPLRGYGDSMHGTVNGSTAGATLEPLAAEPVHGQPAATGSVWYRLDGGGFTPVSFTCSQAYIEVFYQTSPGVITLAAETIFDPSVQAWRCTVFAPTESNYFLCVSNAGGSPAGPFYLNWEQGSNLHWDPATITVAEGAAASLTLTRNGEFGNGGISAPATLTVTPVGDTATAGFDFDAAVQTVTFAAGESSKTITVNTFQDSVHEVTERFTLRLACTQGSILVWQQPFPVVEIIDDDDFMPLPGSFQSLLTSSASAYPSALISATTTRAAPPAAPFGRVTGKVTYDGKAYAFSTAFNASGIATATIKTVRTFNRYYPLPITLTITSTEGGQRLLFDLKDDTIELTSTGDLQRYDARLDPCPCYGTYTAAIAPKDSQQQGPKGTSVATVKISTSGALTMAGTLADGTAFTASGMLQLAVHTDRAQPHAFIFQPLYAPVYGDPGSLAGDLQFNSSLGDNTDFTGTLHWVCPGSASGSRVYHPSFAISTLASGQRYTAPTPGVRALAGLDGAGAFVLSLSGAGLKTPVNHNAWWLVNNRLNTSEFSAPRLALSVTPATGLITGTLTSAGPKPVAQPVRAVILQGTRDVQGFFFDPASQRSGIVRRPP